VRALECAAPGTRKQSRRPDGWSSRAVGPGHGSLPQGVGKGKSQDGLCIFSEEESAQPPTAARTTAAIDDMLTPPRVGLR
jgi:hypothetical protein